MSQLLSQLFSNNYKDIKSKAKIGKKLKIYYFTTVFTSAFIAVIISSFIPNYKERPKFQFPEQVFLSEWQFNSSRDVDKFDYELKSNVKSNIINYRRYLYTSSLRDDLRIDVLYIRGTLVKIPESLEMVGLKFSPQSLDIRYSEKTGYYALFSDQERAYLATCINPNGGTTVTDKQFIANRNKYDITPIRIASYLLGAVYLRDIRCLFTVISLPLDNKQSGNSSNNSLDNTDQKLEKALINWYKQWENKFPEN